MAAERRLVPNISAESDTTHGRWRLASRIAARQHGVVTRGQLRAVGLTDHQITWAVRTVRLRPVHRGVFVFGAGPLSPPGRWSAAVLVCGPTAALGYRSAAAHWDLRPTSARSSEVVVARTMRPTHGEVIVHRHPRMASDEVTEHLGIRVTTVARTVLDLAAVVSPRVLRRAVSQAEILRRFDRHAVELLLERHPGHRGRAPLERLLAAWTEPGTARSPQEESFPELCARFGFPRPVMNAEVLGMEIDAVFFDERIAVELDGYAFHAGAIRWEDDHEKRARLVAAGWTVLAYSYRQQRDDGGRFVRDTLGPALARDVGRRG